ncbi:CcdB family protein [Rhodopila sp.]
MTQNVATVPLAQLRAPIGTLASHRDQVIRAIDALLSGI